MSRTLFILIFFVLTNLIITNVASGDAVETALENCNRVISPLSVSFACDEHINCLFNTAEINCSETTLVRLTHSCAGFDYQMCADVAALTTIMIDSAILNYQTMDSTTQLNNSLSAFIGGDYQTAIDLYENVTLSLDYFPHHILELGLGILYLRFDNPDVALIQFDKSLNLEFYNPVAFYYRGNTYQWFGNSIRALRDHYMYDLLADTQLKATLPLRSFRIQIPDTQLWNLYPVYTLEQGSDQFTLRDDTLEPEQAIVVSFVDDNETLVISEWLDIVAGTDTEILFLERDPQNPLRYVLNINQQDVPDSIPAGKTEISVIVSPPYLELYLASINGQDQTLITSVANEALEPDMRAPNPKRICKNLPLSQLEEGIVVQSLPEAQLILWDDPVVDDRLTHIDLDDTDSDFKDFRIISDPVCFDDRIWWQVSNGTLTGWIAENQELQVNDYAVMPIELIHLWQTNPLSPLQFIGINPLQN